VFPAVVDTRLAHVAVVAGRLAIRTEERSGRAGYRGIADRQPEDGELDAGRDLDRLRPLDDRQLAPLQDEDPVGALGEDVLARAPGPFLMTRQL